ncbi:hypothetical protein CBL_06121 [Carabus blaptoides fortunei]
MCDQFSPVLIAIGNDGHLCTNDRRILGPGPAEAQSRRSVRETPDVIASDVVKGSKNIAQTQLKSQGDGESVNGCAGATEATLVWYGDTGTGSDQSCLCTVQSSPTADGQ